MESQPQNPEFRINPENLHPWITQDELTFVRVILNLGICYYFLGKTLE